MPEPINNGGGAGGDEAAAKAAADKAAADTAAAAAAAGNGGGAGEENVTMTKAEHQKLIEERDNYKKGLLEKKAEERDLHKVPDAAAAAAAGQGAGAGAVDDKKIADAASAATNKTMREVAERTAKRSFLKAHPEYVSDAEWAALLPHLTFKGNELTSEEVSERMEAAVLEHKRSTGKLDEYMKSEHERGVREGRIQGQVGAGHGTGGGGDRNDARAAGALSQKGEEMARAMHTDPAKAAKVDIAKDSVIDVTQKRKS